MQSGLIVYFLKNREQKDHTNPPVSDDINITRKTATGLYALHIVDGTPSLLLT